MSAEVAKKRGRPKKVIADPVEVEMPESTAKATTRAKSTRTTKTTKAVPAAPGKASVAKKTTAKSTGASATSKPAPKATAASAKPVAKVPEKPVTMKSIPTTPTTSKILEQVKELEAKKSAQSQETMKEAAMAQSKTDLGAGSVKDVESIISNSAAKKSTEVPMPQPPMATKSSPLPQQQKPASPPISSAVPPPSPAKSTPPPPPSAKPTPKPHIPIAELNSAIVSNITTRAGARPNTSGSQQLPKNYKPVARKVTMAIVALPIAIVTSYVLYQRLVLGEEKKMLVPAPKPGNPETKAESPSVVSSQ
ncbi:hypothetical protein VTL71DRAFT_7571 [Oculimacula yallundae]|uniref:Uncharacterized protein n=1 Tax=Oculimacula yallundae TaxID=86028 RepID=A0ABR4BX37_9HELO